MKELMSVNRLTSKNDFYSGFLYHKCFDPFTFRLRQQIETVVNQGADVLDVGCGTGRLLTHIGPRINAGVGIDLADRMLAHASKRRDKLGLTNLTFILGNAADLSCYDEDTFDFGLLSLVLHELPPDIRMPAISELIRVSRRQIITDYAVYPGLAPAMMMNLLEATVGFRHFNYFRSYINSGGALSLIKRAGLCVRRETPVLLGMVRIWICEPEETGSVI